MASLPEEPVSSSLVSNVVMRSITELTALIAFFFDFDTPKSFCSVSKD
jgi:hypothetical protein